MLKNEERLRTATKGAFRCHDQKCTRKQKHKNGSTCKVVKILFILTTIYNALSYRMGIIALTFVLPHTIIFLIPHHFRYHDRSNPLLRARLTMLELRKAPQLIDTEHSQLEVYLKTLPSAHSYFLPATSIGLSQDH